MCGRAALVASPEDLQEAFGLDHIPEAEAHYNIPPTQPVAVVRRHGTLEHLAWGLVPFWADDPKIGRRLTLARVETAATTPAFREAIKRRRCLVVVSGFYEWKRPDKKTSLPFFVHRRDKRLFALAGLWERWTAKDGEIIESCAVLTTAARPPVDAVHDRMPIVVERTAWPRWLDRGESHALSHLDSDSSELVAVRVGTYVNDPRHDDARCLEPPEALPPV